jgi:tripartite-type tricarboxylate transporter receptor subunit TctC
MVPGGVMDLHAKILGERLSEILGQPVIREHKPGGGGSLAASFTVRAKPDGYTLFTGTSSNMVMIPVLKKVDYALEDFFPLGIYAKALHRLYVKADAPWKSLREFVAEAKERQYKVSSYGKLTHADFVIQAFCKVAGIKLAHVPYKSCGEAVTALLGGHVDIDVCTSSMGQVAGGSVKVLAVSDHERSKFFPEDRTFKELGYPVALPAWYSLVISQKTPKKVADILANAMQEVFKRYGKEIEKELLKIEVPAAFFDPKESIQLFKKDHEVMSVMAKEFGMIEK